MRRLRQVTKIVREQGAKQLGVRLLTAATRRLGAEGEELPVRLEDVRRADVEERKPVVIPPIPQDGKLTINWVTTPPSKGSGGHTTMFRLIRHLESLGHECRLYLYETFGNAVADLEPGIREAFPFFKGSIHDVTHGMADAHAVFATAWITAYPAFNDPCAGKRFYLVQDYEPWFYPAGGLYALAENTYRMGMHGFTAGRFLADKVRDEHGMPADHFDFGCDADRYKLGTEKRDGIVFYARRKAPRRAFELGVLALEVFAEKHPDIKIHIYGEKIGQLGPQFHDHGLVTPDDLNAIYNRCFAGLSLSMTNVSLVPHEMLAAGCIPVVNDAHFNRVVLDNDHVRYAAPTPHSLARALSEVVTTPDFDATARAAASSVEGRSWDAAGHELEKVLRRELST
jgi:glycosyltransferase involved in cell wall biosynthesis